MKINESKQQTFETMQKFHIHLNNGKTVVRHAKSRYDAHHKGLNPHQMIIGVKRLEHIGPSKIEESSTLLKFAQFLTESKEPQSYEEYLQFMSEPHLKINPENVNETAEYGAPSLGGLKAKFDSALDAHDKMSPKDQKINVANASKSLKEHHNVSKVLTENGKLKKSRLGYNWDGEDTVKLHDGRGVESHGLSMSPAHKIGKFNTCPNSESCKHLCLGKTAGGNFQFGGGANLDTVKGPRLAQRNKTNAFVDHTEHFAVKMHHEIGKAKAKAAKNGNKAAVRLNVTSDIHPKVHESLIKRHPDVQFYDYTKNANAKPVAENHHLTYSSTGTSHREEHGHAPIHNQHQNWHQMKKNLEGGHNIAMAFSHKKELPTHVHDEETGHKYKVIDGDQHDYRPIDEKDGSKGVVVGLRNKAKTTKGKIAAEQSKGFMTHFDPEHHKDGVVHIPKQERKV